MHLLITYLSHGSLVCVKSHIKLFLKQAKSPADFEALICCLLSLHLNPAACALCVVVSRYEKCISQLRATKLFASYTMGVSRNFSQRGHDGQAPWKEASRGEAGIFRVGIE